MFLALLCVAQVQAPPPVDFVKDVQPILRAHCIECHGADKQKGDIRLDLRSEVFHDDKDLWVIIPGDPEESLFLELMKLPADDDDSMPKNEDSLPAEKIALLERWIKEGAKWPESADRAVIEAAKKREMPRLEIPEESRVRRDRVLAALQKDRIPAGRLAVDTDAVEVNFSLQTKDAGDGVMQRLAGLEPCLTRLNVSRTAITDAGLQTLASMGELERLNLARTGIGNGGLAHIAGLKKLHYLNLFGTKVTDAGLVHLEGMKSLRKLYLWQTAVTDAGVERLQKANPELRIDRGGYAEAITKLAQEQAAAKAAKEKAAKEAKKGLNEKCPLTGRPANPKFVAEHNGKKLAVCCAKCLAKVKKDPAKYIK